MVAKIAPTSDLSRILSYNEEKVAQGKAEFIHLKNFLQSKNNITPDEKFERFQQLNDLNTRSRIKMLHATLNFHPSEKLSNTELSAIADRYMRGLQMEKHPYLVYHHKDARHPHIHIVASLIRPDGSRVDTHLLANRLSKPTCKAIEQEFQLLPAQRSQQSLVLPPEDVPKITPHDETPIAQSIDRVLAMVNKHYHFSNLNEYNAVLRAYNITAEPGNPGTKTRAHNGIYYVALDDQGNRISPPVMASRLPSRPTLARLRNKFHHPDPDHLDHVTSIRQRINSAMADKPRTLRQLVANLEDKSIEVVVPPANGRNPHDQVFVDLRTHTAITGETLGPAYTSAAFTYATTRQQRAGHHQRPTAQTPDGEQFSANVPQVLSVVLHTDPAGLDLDTFGKNQHLGARRKL